MMNVVIEQMVKIILRQIFGVNAGKKLGVGFKFDYIYGRGYYQNQSTSHFNYTMYGSYLGDRYDAHILLSTNHQKVTVKMVV